MKALNRTTIGQSPQFPIKILQFGGGNFLRAFVDWMIDILNEQTDFGGDVVLVKPTDRGSYEALRKQEGLFHVDLNGIQNGALKSEQRLVSCLRRIVNPYLEWEQYLKLARIPSIRFVVSNTTEAGIIYSGTDQATEHPPAQFPAKLALWLHARYEHFGGDPDRGCILLPCELIEQNGTTLRECILKYASLWGLGDGFENWILDHNHFCNTLVDRIVSGFPKEHAIKIKTAIGFDDHLLVSGEYYHSWVIQGPEFLQHELPLNRTGLQVKFVPDLLPYREMKVRILNGAHTAMVPVGYLNGFETVGDVINDPQVSRFVEQLLVEEVSSTLKFPDETKKSFIGETLNRFRNPHIRHLLSSIALNSISKFKTRLLPTIVDYYGNAQLSPPRIVFALAALICFYKGSYMDLSIELNDDPEILSIFGQLWQSWDGSEGSTRKIVSEILKHNRLWQSDLTKFQGLEELTTKYVLDIQNLGMSKALRLQDF